MLLKQLRSSAVGGAFLLISATQVHAGALPERVAKAAQEGVADEVYQTVIFGIVDGDQSSVVAFGSLDDGKAPHGDTVYEIGSITKTFTATMLAQEVLSNRVALDTPVSKLVPDFTIPSRDGKQISLGEIGTQHSGLPRMPSNFNPADPNNPYADYRGSQLKAYLATYQLPRDPGASYEYSNLAFRLRATPSLNPTTLPTASLVARQVFEPLGMSMSSTGLTASMRVHLAHGHDENGKPASNWDLIAPRGRGRHSLHDQ